MQDFDLANRNDFLTIIHQQSELMISIINELLDLVRIEERRGADFIFETLDLAVVANEALSGFSPADNRPPAMVVPPSRPLYVNADHTKLLQAITNLISNAYKYSPQGGDINISFSRTTVDGTPMVGVEIEDHGIGMTPAQSARVCERFYRVDPSGHIPGTGLGMSIVKEIIDIHHGHIDIRSSFGQGTTMTIYLPELAPGQGGVV